MNKEKQLANQLFDLFRSSRCKAGQGIMIRSVQFDLMDKLNPKDAEKFIIVFSEDCCPAWKNTLGWGSRAHLILSDCRIGVLTGLREVFSIST